MLSSIVGCTFFFIFFRSREQEVSQLGVHSRSVGDESICGGGVLSLSFCGRRGGASFGDGGVGLCGSGGGVGGGGFVGSGGGVVGGFVVRGVVRSGVRSVVSSSCGTRRGSCNLCAVRRKRVRGKF